jgi:hypothetical protein
MRKLLKWVACAVGAMIVVAVVLWSVARLRGPTAEQEAALAATQGPWTPEGRNAFPYFWQLAYDVPDAAQAEVAAEDLRRMAAAPPPGTDADGSRTPGLFNYASVASQRYPDLRPSGEDHALFCKPREPGCLQRVRADLPRYEALVDRHARLFERVATLADYGHYRSLSPPRMDASSPPMQLGRATITQHAVAFVRGDVDAALAGTCRDIATWRRLGANSDALIMRMVGIAYSTDGYGRLLAEMLAELPRDHPLPRSCAVAVAPAEASELRLCQAMRGEFATSSSAIRLMRAQAATSRNPADRALAPLFFDPEATVADIATTFAPACSDGELQRLAADAAQVGWPEPRRGYWRLECVGNPVGCVLSEIARPAYRDYVLRAQDQGARLKLLSTLLWLREQDGEGRTLEARLDARPSALKSPTRDIEVGDDGRSLRIRQFDAGRGDYWTLPLPPYLWTAPPDA